MKAKFLTFFLIFMTHFCGVEARSLSLEDTVKMIIEESNDVKKAAANIGRARALLDNVTAGRMPKIDATATYTNMVDMDDRDWFGENIVPFTTTGTTPEHVGAVGLKASQTIYTFGKIGFALDMARGALRIAESSKKLAELEMTAAAVQMYWSAKTAEEVVKIAERALNNTRSAERQLTRSGRANRSNLVKIASDVAMREIELNDAKINRDTAFRMLKAYAGIEDKEPIALSTEFPSKFQIIKASTPQPIEWDILEAQVRIYDAEKWQNYAGYAPTIAAFGAYDYRTFADRAGGLFDYYQHGANVGVSLSMPLFDGGAKRAQATASAMSAIAAREDLDKSKRLKTAEYGNLIQKYDHLRHTLKDRNSAKDLAERAYKLSRDRFLAGQTSAAELSDVERALSQMEMAVLNAKLELLTTAEDIKKFLFKESNVELAEPGEKL